MSEYNEEKDKTMVLSRSSLPKYDNGAGQEYGQDYRDNPQDDYGDSTGGGGYFTNAARERRSRARAEEARYQRPRRSPLLPDTGSRLIAAFVGFLLLVLIALVWRGINDPGGTAPSPSPSTITVTQSPSDSPSPSATNAPSSQDNGPAASPDNNGPSASMGDQAHKLGQSARQGADTLKTLGGDFISGFTGNK